MRAERKGPLLPPQHISHAGREPRTLTPKPRLDTHASHPDSRPLQCHRGMVGGEKTLPALRDQADTGDRGSTAAQAATRASRIRLLYKLSGQLGNSSGRVSTSFPPRESQKYTGAKLYIYMGRDLNPGGGDTVQRTEGGQAADH